MLFSFMLPSGACVGLGADAGVGAAGMAKREWTFSVWLLNPSYRVHVQYPF